ncbi:MAG: hypothetical protein QM770_04630 [Tepidisphaeraceae bacterium]
MQITINDRSMSIDEGAAAPGMDVDFPAEVRVTVPGRARLVYSLTVGQWAVATRVADDAYRLVVPAPALLRFNLQPGASRPVPPTTIPLVARVQTQSLPLARLGVVGAYGSSELACDAVERKRAQALRYLTSEQLVTSSDRGTRLRLADVNVLRRWREQNPGATIVYSALNGWPLDLRLLGSTPEAAALVVRDWAKRTVDVVGGLVDFFEGPNEPANGEFNAQVRRGEKDWMAWLHTAWAGAVEELTHAGKPVAGPAYLNVDHIRAVHRDIPTLSALACHPYLNSANATSLEDGLKTLRSIARTRPLLLSELGPTRKPLDASGKPDPNAQAQLAGELLDVALRSADVVLLYTSRCYTPKLEQQCGHMALYTITGQPRDPMLAMYAQRLATQVARFAARGQPVTA